MIEGLIEGHNEVKTAKLKLVRQFTILIYEWWYHFFSVFIKLEKLVFEILNRNSLL